MAWEDKDTRPLPDDGMSLGSYHSDAYTLPGDPVEDEMRSEASHDSYDFYRDQVELPSYRVPLERGVSQPVYEAWIIYYSDNQDAVRRTTFCGLPFCTRYAESSPYVSCITEPHTQDDLSAMTRLAMDGHRASNKGSFPSRLLHGRPESYEATLDARIQKLPRPVQAELDGLLGDRKAATGNRFHKRDWTVAMMREQYHFRFATAEYEEVKKSGNRFWKKGGAKRPLEYFFIIRGGEGRVAADDKGMQTTTRHGNPWRRVDEFERDRKQIAKDIRRYGKDYEMMCDPPRDRSPSPPPRRVRLESESPVSLQPGYPNPFTPGPQFSPHFTAPPPACGPFPPGSLSPPHPFHDMFSHPAMPRTCPYIGMMGRHPPLPPPPPPMSPPLFGFAGTSYPRPPPPSPPPAQPIPMPMRPPPEFTTPMHGPPRKFNLVPQLASLFGPTPPVNPCVNNDPIPDFDFDAFLRHNDTPPHPLPLQSTGSSRRASPPPAPRLSNLTTPTTFSRASSARSNTGSSVDGSEVSTPADGVSLELRVGEEEVGSRDGSLFDGYR